MRKFEWEKIHLRTVDGLTMRTTRAKVPGGWLIQNATLHVDDKQVCISESITFVPDVAHKWEVENV